MDYFAYDDAGETIRLGVCAENYRLPVIADAQATKAVFDAVQGLKLRQDDVMLVTYPKTGKSMELLFVGRLF